MADNARNAQVKGKNKNCGKREASYTQRSFDTEIDKEYTEIDTEIASSTQNPFESVYGFFGKSTVLIEGFRPEKDGMHTYLYN